MIPFDFHYMFPQAAYLIVLSFLAILLLWKLYKFRVKSRFSADMVQTRSFTIFSVKTCLTGVALAMCVLALMQPVGNGRYLKVKIPDQKLQSLSLHPIELKRKAHDVIFLVDASASMAVKDARLEKSRLEYAKIVAEEIIASLTGETVALYAFTTKISELSPLTLDYIYERLSLKAMQINESDFPGTSITGAYGEIHKKYFSKDQPDEESNRLRTLIILSDGGDTAFEDLSPTEKNKALESMAKAVQDAGQHHLRIYTIGMGSGQGGIVPDVNDNGKPVNSKLEKELLEVIAKNGRGQYYEANQYTPGQLAKEVLASTAQDPPYYDEKPQEVQEALLQRLLGSSKLIYDRYFQFPLAIALLALAFVLFFPDRLKRNSLLLLFWIVPIMAQENVDSPDILRAQGYVEAHMYEQARAIYERMLISPLPDFEEAALRYNVGTTYLLEHSVDQAITQFRDVMTKFNIHESNSATWKLLQTRIYRNLALAYYEKALFDSTKTPIESLNELNDALEFNSLLPDQQKEPMQTDLKRSVAFQHLVVERIHDKTLSQGILKLLSSLEDFQEALGFLKQATMPTNLKKPYRELFLKDQKAWLPVWVEEEKKIKSDESLKLFQEASQHYKKMIDETSNDNPIVAIQAANESEAALSALLQNISGGDITAVYLGRLLNDYQRLLMRRNWSSELIDRINQRYNALKKIKPDKILQAELDKSQQSFQEAISAHQTHQLLLAQLLKEDGLQWIKLAMAASQRPIKSTNVLINLLQEQKYAEIQLQKYRKLQDSQTSQELIKKFEEIVKASQAEVELLSSLFYSQVFEEQKEAFQKEGLCQASPWGQVFPLFEEGQQSAKQANSLLISTLNYPGQVLTLQSNAIQQWEKALAEIKNPTAKNSSCNKNESKSSDFTNSTTQLESLNVLLKMEAEDRKPSKPISVQSGGIKPW